MTLNYYISSPQTPKGRSENMKTLLLFLTCADSNEAHTIAEALLKKHLVACAKQLPVSSQFLWQGTLDSAQEILLIMETVETKFDEIEQEIKKLHSYDTFVLTAIEIVKSSSAATAWIRESLKL
jgi:periplasmic divalent cation tolerance protein